MSERTVRASPSVRNTATVRDAARAGLCIGAAVAALIGSVLAAAVHPVIGLAAFAVVILVGTPVAAGAALWWITGGAFE